MASARSLGTPLKKTLAPAQLQPPANAKKGAKYISMQKCNPGGQDRIFMSK
jgi:hypothetical protein